MEEKLKAQYGSLKNKKILITGITGFIGSHLSKRLKEIGMEVYGISLSGDQKNIFKINTSDYLAINKLIKDLRIDMCVHLAGNSLVEQGQIDPFNTYSANIMGTLNVLESSRKNNLERIIIASTSQVYGINRPPFYEKNQLYPTRPYETSKACVDLIAQSYALEFKMPILIPRFVNIYGPGDLNFNRLIPKTMNHVLRGESPKMWGGNAIRDFLFVDDAINAFITLLTVNMDYVGNRRIFNFGTGNITSVIQIINKIIALHNKRIKISKIRTERKREINNQYVSWALSKKLLKWSPKTSLEEGLRATFNWYKKYFEENLR